MPSPEISERERRVLEWDVRVRRRKPGRAFGDARHAVRGRVAAGEEGRAGRRAESRCVKVRVAQTEPRDARHVRPTEQVSHEA